MKMTDCFVCGGKMWLKKSGDEEKISIKNLKELKWREDLKTTWALLGRLVVLEDQDITEKELVML